MTTLHELLKRNEAVDREQTPRVDLRGRYSPIGISAVAAACRYNADDEQDRSQRRSASR
jgi:hypothetical protein